METKYSSFWLGVQSFMIKIIIFFLKPIAFVWKKLEPKKMSSVKAGTLAFFIALIIWLAPTSFLILNVNGDYWSYGYVTWWAAILLLITQIFLTTFLKMRFCNSKFKDFELNDFAGFIVGVSVIISILFFFLSIFSFLFGTYKNDYTKAFTDNKCSSLYSTYYEDHVGPCKEVKAEALYLTNKNFKISKVVRIGNTQICSAELSHKPEKAPAFSFELEYSENLCNMSQDNFKLLSVDIYQSSHKCVAKENQIIKIGKKNDMQPIFMYICYVFEKIN